MVESFCWLMVERSGCGLVVCGYSTRVFSNSGKESFMNQGTAEMVRVLERGDFRLKEIGGRFFSGFKNEELASYVLRELFMKPYLPSKAVCEECGLTRESLKEIYLRIRSSDEIKSLFECSPFVHLFRVLHRLSCNSEQTLRVLRGQRPFPLVETMELFISEECNAECKFCYRDGSLYAGKAMETRSFVNLINEFADLNGLFVDISGGLEPLLSGSFVGIVNAALAQGLKVGVYTNGIALDSPDVVACMLGVDRVRISLNACDRDGYMKVAGVDKFDVVKGNLKRFLRDRDSCGSKVHVGIGFVVYCENYRMIPEVVRFAAEMGVDFIDLRSIHVTGGLSEKQRDELKEIIAGVKEDILAGKYPDLYIDIADTFSIMNGGIFDYLDPSLVGYLKNYRITVSPEGKVYALNVAAQPGMELSDYCLGMYNEHNSLEHVLACDKPVPYEPAYFLPHDLSLVLALSKLESDLKFGIGLDEEPF